MHITSKYSRKIDLATIKIARIKYPCKDLQQRDVNFSCSGRPTTESNLSKLVKCILPVNIETNIVQHNRITTVCDWTW